MDIGAYEYGSHPFPVGTREVVLKNTPAMVVYPNPAAGMINVTTPAASGDILIMDLSGRLLYKNQVSDVITTIDVHNFPGGMYLISHVNGSTRSTQKLIVQ